jgi:hypothetical protein
MRKHTIKFLASFFALVLLFSGCTKNANELSKPTFWPDIQINGDDFVIVAVGTSYTDESAVVTVNGAPIPFETTSDVDASEVGAYTVTYTAQNDDGVSASKTRTVIVVDEDALLDDLSGTYQRGTGTPMSVWAKDADRLYMYRSNNPGGVPNNPPFNVPFVIYNVAPGIVVVPLQTSPPLAPFSAQAGSVGGDPQIPFNVGAAVGSVAYSWFMNGPNFGAVARTFVKR